MLVSIWNSATNYAKDNTKHRGWARAAKTTVVLSALVLMGSISEMISGTSSSIDDTQPETEAMISGLNADLPRKVDNVTILEKIDMRNNMVLYYFTVTADITNPQAFKTAMTHNLLSMACSDKDMSSMLEANYTLDWIYSVATPPNSITIAATKSDCPNL
jgi:hypothetical protein